MSLERVLLVLRKELLDVARDRRALFVMLVLPIILYPLVTIGFTYVSYVQLRKLEQKSATVWVRDLAHVPSALVAELGVETRRLVVSEEPEGKSPDDETTDLAEGRVHAIVHPPDDLTARIAEVTSSTIEIVYNAGIDSSLEARRKVVEAIHAWRDQVVKERLVARQLPVAFVDPVTPTFRDTARKGAVLSRLLTFLLVITTLLGSFYPALDLGAGEKERGTLETLLLAPATRVELAAGKFAAIFVLSFAGALLNLGSLGFTFAHFGSFVGGGALAERLGTVSLTAEVVLAMLAVLVPLVALFSALALALSVLATSFKEGSSYLQPVGLVTTLLSAASALPGVELNAFLCLVPVAGAALLFKELLSGTAHLGHAVLVFVSSVSYAVLAVRWVGRLFEREEVLVRPANAAGLNLLRPARPAPGEPLVPSLPQALAGAVGALLLFWYLGQKLQQWSSDSHLGIVPGLVATLVGVIALPPILYARGLRLDLRATFKLRPPPVLALVAALLIAVGGQLLAHDVTRIQSQLTGEPLPQERVAVARFLAEIAQYGAGLALLVIAFLPALCEELLFRGFVLTGLRKDSGPVAAALVSAFFFGINHLDPARLGAVSFLGVLLAILVLRSGSIFPAVLCHFANNGLALAIFTRADDLERWGVVVDGRPSWIARAVSLALVGMGLALLARTRPDGDD